MLFYVTISVVNAFKIKKIEFNCLRGKQDISNELDTSFVYVVTVKYTLHMNSKGYICFKFCSLNRLI